LALLEGSSVLHFLNGSQHPLFHVFDADLALKSPGDHMFYWDLTNKKWGLDGI
jgi:hypothetical protein